MREIRILKRLNHSNVISIQELAFSVASQPAFFIVFPFVEHDLVGLLDAPNIRFTVPQIKYYTKQLLQGVAYLHSKNMLHRDIKSESHPIYLASSSILAFYFIFSFPLAILPFFLILFLTFRCKYPHWKQRGS